MYCDNCGASMSPNAKFCPECGQNRSKQVSSVKTRETGREKDSDFNIPSSIKDNLPSMVKKQLARLPLEDQSQFIEEYKRKKKSTGMAYFLWFVIGLHYIYIGKTGMQLFYWITGAGFMVWAFIDLFRIPGLVRDHNKDVAVDVMRDIKVMGV